jgi:hypothetical protein
MRGFRNAPRGSLVRALVVACLGLGLGVRLSGCTQFGTSEASPDGGEPEEEGQPNDDDPTTDPSDEASTGRRRVFVSEGLYDGDLELKAFEVFRLPKGSGALAADRICAGEAAGLKLGGSWRAWVVGLDDAGASVKPITRFRDRGERWDVPRTRLVFANLGQGPQGGVPSPDGGSSSGNVWTGLDANGNPTNAHCNHWTSDGPDGNVGTSMPDATANWQGLQTAQCTSRHHLYCFED